MEPAAAAEIPEEVADIFNAPSDEEDFFGFGDDVPMETLYLEESFDSPEPVKKDVRFHPQYITEELRRIFTEDTDSETDDFEGFTPSELNVHPELMLAQLLAELHSLPDLFPVQTPSPTYKKKPVRRAFSEGQITRRTNPTRSARPPEKFAVENFTVSTNFEEDLCDFRRRKKMSGGKCRVYRKRRLSSFRRVDEITEDDLENIAVTVRDKIYDKVLGNTCHQCRQKTIDTKTVCRNLDCGGVRGQFCGPCLRNRYGEDVRSALLDPDWVCPPCRGICNCSYCRRRDGRCATGILIHLAKFYGYNNVKEYLESIQKQLVEDH
ncbi:cell division cycle-associated 7-like protein isoform X2 [Notamacropus eugenii]|uniref:cell division cycle-associated 7-like protein isoform X2 n=1 Tax=Notamacropus eugenii TaxID=9315 RepID=UPI003B679CD1